MSQEVRNAALKEKTKTLLEGPLKHIRGAALAAALLPLASIAAAPASAQTPCDFSAGTCTISGVVWDDQNNNGIQDGEPGIEDAAVTLYEGTPQTTLTLIGTVNTGPDGSYSFTVPNGTYTIVVSMSSISAGTQASPVNATDDSLDSDGMVDGYGNSYTSVALGGFNNDSDFGFFTPTTKQPGTGTPGYWKNHRDAWPVTSIIVGGVKYTRDEAIYWLGMVGKDKTTSMFSSLVSAMLNTYIVVNGVHNDSSCIASTIVAANAWMAMYGPVGSNVAASSYAWSVGEPLHKQMDAYNNGLLCAPHRN
jgi:hypothetical protein